jgi:putative flippase GtrA
MFSRLFVFIFSLRKEFIKYFLVGISGFILDIVSLILLKEFLGIDPVYAVIINQVFIISFIFLLNKHFSFHNKNLPYAQMARFAVLTVFNYLYAVSMMYVFNKRLEFDYRIVRTVSIATMVSWNFFLYKYWVYK